MPDPGTSELAREAPTRARPRLADPHAAEFPDARGFSWAGVVLAALGVLALVFPLVSTIAVTLVIGVAFLAAGLVKLWRARSARPISRAALKALWALVYVIGGGLILYAPVAGAWSLTLVLAALLIIGGVASIAWALAPPRLPGWFWMMASGIISLALGVLVWVTLPISAFWLPGVLVGVDLITTGIAFIAMDRAATQLRRDAEIMPT